MSTLPPVPFAWHPALALDGSRAPLHRLDPAEALDLWRSMVAGHWTVVDRFDRGGRRFIVARRGTATGCGTGPLTPREHRAATLAALGYTNKLIGYALGTSPSTVTRRLQRAATKLGARSRTELIRAVCAIS